MNRYKYFDFFLILFVLLFIIIFTFRKLNFDNILIYFFKTAIALFVFSLFFYEKAKGHKVNLFPKFQNFIQRLEYFFQPIFKFSSSIIKPFKIGQGIMIDISQLMLVALLLIFLIIF